MVVNERQRSATNAQILVEHNDTNYDGSCMLRHFRSGTYEISGRLISVGQRVCTASTGVHCDTPKFWIMDFTYLNVAVTQLELFVLRLYQHLAVTASNGGLLLQ
jgi:hypothetical protein